MALALAERETEKAKAWWRQPGESTQAYARFLVYRDQPFDQRSLRKVGVSFQLAGRWSRRWSWVARAQAWDDDLLAAADSLSVSAVLGLRRRQLDSGLALVDAAEQSAAKLDRGKRTVEDVALLLDTGMRHARIAVGLPPSGESAAQAPAASSASVAVAFGSSTSGQFGSVRVGPAWLAQPSQTERSEDEAKPNPVVQVGEQVLAEGNPVAACAHSDAERLVDRVVNNPPGKLAGNKKSAFPGGVKRGAKRRDSRGGRIQPPVESD